MTPDSNLVSSWPTRVAALLGGLGVALGAFGAHGLQSRLTALNTAEIYHTAVLYHFLHALMLFLLAGRAPFRRGPYFLFLIGIVIFSGSLYILALTGQRGFGAVTPLGGVAFLAGWLWLAMPEKKKT